MTDQIANVTYLSGLRHSCINAALALLQKVLEEGIVEELGSLGLWEKRPGQERQFEGVVKRNPVEDEIPKRLDKGKEGKEDPVNQPLNVIPLGLGFNCLKGLERRVDKANDRAQHASSDSEEDQQDEDKPPSEH